MKIYDSVTELIGKTPLLRLNRLKEKIGFKSEILAKLEYFNPLGSVKDRAALFMIKDAEEKGLLKENGTIIEPTSGNTGLGLAYIAASKGYKMILTMPDTMSIERIKLAKALGAEVVLTDGVLGMTGAIKKAEELNLQIEGSFIPQQFENPANPESHRKTTALELLEDTDNDIDIFVAGVGTGGTLSGIGEVLKSKLPDVKIVAVEPENSAVISGREAGKHGLQGIGAGFIPKNLNKGIVDEVITVTEEEAYSASREIARTEGVLVGISSGAALFAAVKLALRPENEDKKIVVLLPDTGERYLSTDLF